MYLNCAFMYLLIYCLKMLACEQNECNDDDNDPEYNVMVDEEIEGNFPVLSIFFFSHFQWLW